MQQQLRPKQIRTRLLILMSIIILTILFIAIPQIIQSYQQYNRSHQSLIDIETLRIFAETSNKISRERAPTNKALSSAPENLAKKVEELQQYRLSVDQQINLTIATLNQTGYPILAQRIDTQLRADLAKARRKVDAYLALPVDQRTEPEMDASIQQMFIAWDSGRNILQDLIIELKTKNSEVTDYASLILVLSDLRDQAGRVASNIMAPLSYSNSFPEVNKARSLQAQEQVKYLWHLMDTLQPNDLKTAKYLNLYQQVKAKFIDQGLPVVNGLIDESRRGQAYSLTANQLTDAVVDKFTTVVDLQTYLLEMHSLHAQKEMHIAQRQFFLSLVISLLSLAVALFTMLYTRKKLFDPLMTARQTILELTYLHQGYDAGENMAQVHEDYTLTDALENLKEMLKQRDIFEFQLKNVANTDSLTGVSNRLALDAYLKSLDNKLNAFQQLSLIVVDIDHFKQVNDQYGHIFGDAVIIEIAQCLKANIAQSDLIVRFGGDEFLVVLAHADRSWVLQIAESILADISRLNIHLPYSSEPLKVSVSIGVATGAESWEALFNQADASLFKAKAQGRNKVVGR